MSTEQPGAARIGTGRFLALGIGFAIGLAFVLGGSAVVLMLLIGGLWEGFGRTGFVLLFLAVCLYVYGTAFLAFRFALRPSRLQAILLAVLVAPSAVYLATGVSETAALRDAARTYALNQDPEAVEQARQTLLAQGRRAGRKVHVDELLDHLGRADNDEQRVRLVRMLGELSYQYAPLLEALRALHRETRHEPQRQALHGAVEAALLQVNPYERLPEDSSAR